MPITFVEELEGRVALISGATGELGSAVCRRLLRAGMRIEMMGRDPKKLAEVRLGIGNGPSQLERLGTQVADVNNPDSVRQAIEEIVERRQRIDLLINAAGDGPVAAFLDTTEALWQGTLQGKLMGTVRLTQAVAAVMRRQGTGHVVIINGTFSREPHPLFPISSTVNCALAGFAKAISHDLGSQGIRVNVVNPGITESPLWSATASEIAGRSGVSAEEVNRQLLVKNPMGRFATPNDVAEAVFLLVHPVASYLNGVSLDVDGGAVAAV